MKVILLIIAILFTACEMNEQDKQLLESLKGKDKFQKGKIRFETTTNYWSYVENIIPPSPPLLTLVPNTSIAGNIINLPSIILLGYNDFISSYNTGFRFKEGAFNASISFPPPTPNFILKDNNLVITAINNSYYQIIFLGTSEHTVQSRFFADGIAKTGDIVLLQIPERLPGAFLNVQYIVETLIHCVEMPAVSFIELAQSGDVSIDYLKIDIVSNLGLAADPPGPDQRSIPINIIRQNIWGEIEQDTINPNVFSPADSTYNTYSIDIPLSMNLKNTEIVVARNFVTDVLDFTFNIKIKN